MNSSILASVKKLLGLQEDYTVFDLDVIMYINAALATLKQLGVGPIDGFVITNYESVWSDFLGDEKGLNLVQPYVGLKVRMAFDPPATSFHLDAMKAQLSEYEYRITTYCDLRDWLPPTDVRVLDGGVP